MVALERARHPPRSLAGRLVAAEDHRAPRRGRLRPGDGASRGARAPAWIRDGISRYAGLWPERGVARADGVSALDRLREGPDRRRAGARRKAGGSLWRQPRRPAGLSSGLPFPPRGRADCDHAGRHARAGGASRLRPLADARPRRPPAPRRAAVHHRRAPAPHALDVEDGSHLQQAGVGRALLTRPARWRQLGARPFSPHAHANPAGHRAGAVRISAPCSSRIPASIG